MDWLKDIVVLILGGLFSGTALTALLFYRQIRRQHQAGADKAQADVDKTKAETNGVKVAVLGSAIELLRAENERLSDRLDIMQTRIDTLQTRVDEVCIENMTLKAKVNSVEIENALLKGRLIRMRRILFELRRGLSMIIAQVCDAHLEPVYRVPDEILELLGECSEEEDDAKPS